MGKPLKRFEAYQEKRQREEEEENSTQSVLPAEASDTLKYRLSTTVPDYWTPLIPVRIKKGKPDIRLQGGKVLLNRENEPVFTKAEGQILNPVSNLSLYEEEVPREGARVTRAYQLFH